MINNERLRFLADFLRYLGKRFVDDDCMETAGLLCYATLLSLVPLLAVVLSMFSAFSVFDQWSDAAQNFLFKNFVPAAGEVIQKNINQFVQKASTLTAAGIVFLIVTALILMSNIERSLNRIFRVHRARSLTGRLLVYWSTLTVGPLLLGASFGVSSYLLSLPLVVGAAEGIGGVPKLLKLAPVIASSVAFSLMFVIVPHRVVRWRHAVTGGVVAALLLELAKSGFGLYVTHFPTYNKIYGALAAIPIFLVWVYLSWVVILLGASLTAALSETWRLGARGVSTERHPLFERLRVLETMWAAQRVGRSISEKHLARRLEMQPDTLSAVCEQLAEAGILGRVADGEWATIRDLDEVSVIELIDLIGGELVFHINPGEQSAPWEGRLLELLAPSGPELRSRLSLSVKSLFS